MKRVNLILGAVVCIALLAVAVWRATSAGSSSIPGESEAAWNEFFSDVLEAVNTAESEKPDLGESKMGGEETSVSGSLKTALYVDGNQVPCEVVFKEDLGYAEIPILAVVKALGYPIRQMNESTFEVEIGEKGFLVDIAEAEVVDKDDPHLEDLIITTPGATFFFKEARNGDIFVDQYTLRTVLMFMGV